MQICSLGLFAFQFGSQNTVLLRECVRILTTSPRNPPGGFGLKLKFCVLTFHVIFRRVCQTRDESDYMKAFNLFEGKLLLIENDWGMDSYF